MVNPRDPASLTSPDGGILLSAPLHSMHKKFCRLQHQSAPGISQELNKYVPRDPKGPNPMHTTINIETDTDGHCLHMSCKNVLIFWGGLLIFQGGLLIF